MSIVDGVGLITWNGCLFDPAQPLLAKCKWVDREVRAAGGSIFWNEAGRPYGVPSDRYALSASSTASGLSTVWYQWGRFERGETPSAANPLTGVLASEHTQGKATDSNAPTVFDMQLREQKMRAVGMIRTIPSESWHFAERLDPTADFSMFADYSITPITNTEEDILMAGIDDLIGRLDTLIQTVAGDDATKVATIVRNYEYEGTFAKICTALIYPDGNAVKLNDTQDVTAAVTAHAVVYGLKPTNSAENEIRSRYGSQITDKQWNSFWDCYPGQKIGFDAAGH